MCLTESQAGSDVGASKTRAVRACLTAVTSSPGQKDLHHLRDHDMTESVVHAVLARLPDAPEGAKGLSLFVVPKILVNADGSLGRCQRCSMRQHRAQARHS